MGNPFPLMSKGEEKQIGRGSIGLLVDVAINAKGGDYWKYCHLMAKEAAEVDTGRG